MKKHILFMHICIAILITLSITASNIFGQIPVDIASQPIYQFKTIGSQYIIKAGDTVDFPQLPAMHTSYVLKGSNRFFTIQLNLVRKNAWEIEYRLTVIEAGRKKYLKKGVARLNSTFYMGCETDEDDETGLSYFSNEFTQQSGKKGFIQIRTGLPEEKERDTLQEKLSGKIILYRIKKMPGINLHQCPTLRQQ